MQSTSRSALNKHTRGVSVIEVLMVSVVISMIALTTFRLFSESALDSQIDTTIIQLSNWQQASAQYYTANNKWPTDTTQLIDDDYISSDQLTHVFNGNYYIKTTDPNSKDIDIAFSIPASYSTDAPLLRRVLNTVGSRFPFRLVSNNELTVSLPKPPISKTPEYFVIKGIEYKLLDANKPEEERRGGIFECNPGWKPFCVQSLNAYDRGGLEQADVVSDDTECVETSPTSQEYTCTNTKETILQRHYIPTKFGIGQGDDVANFVEVLDTGGARIQNQYRCSLNFASDDTMSATSGGVADSGQRALDWTEREIVETTWTQFGTSDPLPEGDPGRQNEVSNLLSSGWNIPVSETPADIEGWEARVTSIYGCCNLENDPTGTCGNINAGAGFITP